MNGINGSTSFPALPRVVGYFLVVLLEGVPLCEQVVVALVARLHPAGRVHGAGAGRPRVTYQRRVEGLLQVRHLLGKYVGQGAFLELVAADVAHLQA